MLYIYICIYSFIYKPSENPRENGGLMGFDGILWDITTTTTGWWFGT